MDKDERQRKLEAGRAKKSSKSSDRSLASYRQKRAKGCGPGLTKKAQKGKSEDVPPQNDCPAQDSHLESAPASANRHQVEAKSRHEADQMPRKSNVRQNIDSDSSPSPEPSPYSLETLKDEDLAALTGREQLKRLQDAVEKRNEIITKLSANLQDALSSRDQVQLEVQSLSGQIQALQQQLHKTSVEFSRIKSLHGHSSDSDSSHKDTPLTELGHRRDEDITAIVEKLKLELEKEKEKGQSLFDELQKERSTVLLLEEEKKDWEEEMKRSLIQLKDLQSQCLEMQQYKREKERLNIEVSDLKKRLLEEEGFHEEAAGSARLLRSLGAELDSVRKQLEEREKELKFREEEVVGLKASKNRQNQARAGFIGSDSNPGDCEDADLDNESTEDSLNVSQMENVLMERYLSSEPSTCPQPLQDSDSQMDQSVECSFELNSEVLGDQALASISNCHEDVDVHDISSPSGLPQLPSPHCPDSQSLLRWPNTSQNDKLDISETSDHSGETHLEKDLLYQQCRELLEELALKDKDLNVLGEEVSKSADDLEEARSRWAQVTEELREALLGLEQEKEKRVQLEILLKSHEREELQTRTSALFQMREEEQQQQQEEMEEEDPGLPEETVDLLLFSPQQSKRRSNLAKLDPEAGHQLLALQILCDQLKSELETTQKELNAASYLLDQRTVELDDTMKDLQSSRTELLNVQTQMDELRRETDKSKADLDQAEKERSNLESRVVCLSQNVANLEETQVKALTEKEMHQKRAEEMCERISNMEQILEEEREQLEDLLKSKEAEVKHLNEEKEKWEEEKQEKDKELSDVSRLLEELKQNSEKELKELLDKQQQAMEEATEKVRRCYQEEIAMLKQKHHQESLELKSQLEQLLEQQVLMKEEQKRQINLIKQVTEREHERMTVRHTEQLEQKESEVVLEVRESMEAAHQAELKHAQAQKALELEALRLSLTTAPQSESELSHDAVVTKIQTSMTGAFSQERAMIQARHQTDLDQIRRHSWEEQERLQQSHQSQIDKLNHLLEGGVSTEGTTLEEVTKGVQALKSKLEEPALLWGTLVSEAQTNKALIEVGEALSGAQPESTESPAKLGASQTSSNKERQRFSDELQDSRAASRLLEAAFQDKEQQVLLLLEKEGELQQEILNLQKEKALLKQSSQLEVSQLWTQLESMRTSRQELGELKEQLRARSCQVEDIERLKVEFNEQKREIKQQNEAELESLRRYFEQRLRVAEEGYQEEITLLQLRMVEGALEETVLYSANDSEFKDVEATEGGGKMLDSLRHQLEEQHSMELDDLRSSLSDSFKEELRQARSDITDQFYKELQEKKSRHSLEMEQLRAKLSESHLRELNRLHLESARHIEVELEQRTWFLTEELRKSTTIIHALESRLSALSNQHKADVQSTVKLKEDFAAELAHLENALQERVDEHQRMSTVQEQLRLQHESELGVLKEEFGREKAILDKALQEESRRLRSLQSALDQDANPQLVRGKRLEEHFEKELKKTKSSLEEGPHQAQQRFQGDRVALEHHLSQTYELSLSEVKGELALERSRTQAKHSQEMDSLTAKYTAQLDALSTSHREQLAAMAAELQRKHNAELVALEAALHSQRKLDLASLEAAFQETSQAQLEAQEAKLEREHQEDRDELERRMLGNMDTLEATYLKEVQTQRDAMMQLEERLWSQSEKMTAEQQRVQAELRRQLSQEHVDKVAAVAAELAQAHKTELSSQREALDTEHCNALEALKKQVLELEHQHSSALQELTTSCAAENRKLTEQHQLQLQELRSASVRELEACRRELQEESARQRQHFNEEVELLKAQSEERLRDRVNKLQAELEEQTEAELGELRRVHSSEQEQKEKSYSSKMNQLTAQLQQLDTVVAQLREEVGCLQGELEGKRSEMETLDTLLRRRERESQEGGNLLKMLTEDLQAAKGQKSALLSANERLRRVLVDMLRSAIATEEMIGRKMMTHGKTQAGQSSTGNKDAQESVADLSSEDLELTHTLCESLLVSDTKLTVEGEEAALSASGRLHRSVSTLLDLLNQANSQLEETHTLHVSLEQKLIQGREDSAQFIEQHKLLMEQLNEEAKQKSALQLELHKTEGLLQGFVADKAILEESLQLKEAQEERLAEELESLKVRLHQMQNLSKELDMLRHEHQELSEEHAILLRHKEHLSADLGEKEKALLAEVEHLTRDRLDLQRQAEKDHSSLSQRIKTLQRDLEEQETKGLETELQHQSHTEDLQQRVQALEKQLKHNRHFIEEQAVEREHERDEFQQEIKKLESQLKQPTGPDNKGLKVETLQASIKDVTEDHATLLAANQKHQRDLAERNEEIDKLTGRIRELEQAVLSSTETSRTLNQLEKELHKAMLREQELTQDKQSLEQQQLVNRLQISALQTKVDETRLCHQQDGHEPSEELREALDTAQQNLHIKEKEMDALLIQLETTQRDLVIKEVELKHLTLQLESMANQNAAQVKELQKEVTVLKENVSALTIHMEQREDHPLDTEAEEDTFPSALLREKNLEIDQLHHDIQRLEQELEHSTENKDLEMEQLHSQVEDLRSQVEHLRSDTLRIRQDKQEEEERLHEVISTLQAELATLGPNLHEVSDSQDGDSINPSPAPSPEPQHLHLTAQDLDKKVRPVNLRQELGIYGPASTRNLRSRLKALQSQLDTAVAEKEGLERLLHRQEEEYRGQGEEFGEKMKTQIQKVEELEKLLDVKKTELEQFHVQLQEQEDMLKAMEDQVVRYKAEIEDIDVLREEKLRLDSLILELQSNEKGRLEEIDYLKLKEQETELEIGMLRHNSVTLERQLQKVQEELRDMKAVVVEESSEVKSLERTKEELIAQRGALCSREEALRDQVNSLKQERLALQRTVQELMEKERSQGEEQKEVLSRAEQALVKADAALEEKEIERQALYKELNTAKRNLRESAKTSEKLQVEAQRKDQALTDLESRNQQLQSELQILQDEELVRHSHQQDGPHKESSHTEFGDVLGSLREVSLCSPEVLRRLDCSEGTCPERLHTVLESHLSELSALNTSALDLKLSPRIIMETPQSRTLTPEPVSRSSRSLQSGSNYSTMDSLDTDKVQELEGLTMPSSPLGSTSSLSAPEWASDGYGSNVSSELGARLRVELEQTERLDAQFVEYLRCRGINPTANTDSAAGSMSFSDELLSPELQALLRKVYQESCKILTLSQRHQTPAPAVTDLPPSWTQQRSVDGSSLREEASPPMSWQQEKRALQETVIALRELLCRMAQRHNADESGQLQDGHVELQLRAELEERQKEVQLAHNVQQEHKNKIQSLRASVEEGEEALRRERSTVQMLQQELEQERTRSLRKDIEDGERREAQHASCELQKSEVMTLRAQVEQERVTCSNVRRELQIEQSRCLLLEKHLQDVQNELEQSNQQCVLQQDVSSQEKARLQHLLDQAESHLTESHDKLLDVHRKLDEERSQSSKHLDELTLQHKTEVAKDHKFISDLRSQLDQQGRRSEELASTVDQLRREALQSRRSWEEEERALREEMFREKEAATQQKVVLESLNEQKQEAYSALGAQKHLSKRQGEEISELKERLQLMKTKELEREEQLEKKRRKERWAEAETKKRQQNTHNKLSELESLRQQDQQRMHELQQTLAELEREEQEMATQRLAGLHGRGTKATLPPPDTPNTQMQRLYGRYLRAESFRKALVYQKRYLLLLIGGFQQCEKATLCLIASMGARPSPYLSVPVRRNSRFKVAVYLVIAISRMRFLTRKWQKAIQSVSLSSSMKGPASEPKAEVLRPQQPSLASAALRRTVTLVPPGEPTFRLHRRSSSSSILASPQTGATPADPEKSLSEYIQHLEKVQHRLAGVRQGTADRK